MTSPDPQASQARSDSGSLSERLARQIEIDRVPGASIAIWDRGGVETAVAGMANQDTGVTVDAHTIFQIGSITKAFTASLILVLVDAGEVDLDAPVRDYLPTFRISGAPAGPAMTVRMLLDHSSGIAGDYFEDFGPDPSALARYVEACGDLPLLFAPGTMRSYSSTAYCVAGQVIERVTGQSYEAALVERLLKPLGLERYAFYTHDIARYRTAVGHRIDGDGFALVKDLRLPYAMSASGASLTMSAVDLLRFGVFNLRRGVTEDGTLLLSEAAIDTMIEPFARVPPNDSERLIGWGALGSDRGRMMVTSGQTVEQNAFLLVSPSQDFAMSILTNTGGGAQRLLLSLGAALLRERRDLRLTLPTPASAATGPNEPALSRYVGDYTNITLARVDIEGDHLTATFSAKAPASQDRITQTLALHPVKGDQFVGVSPESETPAGVFEFLFQSGENHASHISTGGRLFARCDAQGRTGVGARTEARLGAESFRLGSGLIARRAL